MANLIYPFQFVRLHMMEFGLPGMNFSQLLFPILSDLYGWIKTSAHQLKKIGMYEVLNYDSTLEILDREGKEAIFYKTEVVRFLQDNIIAFQDQAWGDGQILLDYLCSPGVPVDFYRSGHKTHVLISLREVKKKGDQLTFNIKWKIKNGFLTQDGYWGTDVSHFTHKLSTQIIFPRDRQPKKIILIEPDRRKSNELTGDSITQLSDKRWQISWEKSNPKLNDQYLLKWVW